MMIVLLIITISGKSTFWIPGMVSLIWFSEFVSKFYLNIDQLESLQKMRFQGKITKATQTIPGIKRRRESEFSFSLMASLKKNGGELLSWLSQYNSQHIKNNVASSNNYACTYTPTTSSHRLGIHHSAVITELIKFQTPGRNGASSTWGHEVHISDKLTRTCSSHTVGIWIINIIGSRWQWL